MSPSRPVALAVLAAAAVATAVLCLWRPAQPLPEVGTLDAAPREVRQRLADDAIVRSYRDAQPAAQGTAAPAPIAMAALEGEVRIAQACGVPYRSLCEGELCVGAINLPPIDDRSWLGAVQAAWYLPRPFIELGVMQVTGGESSAWTPCWRQIHESLEDEGRLKGESVLPPGDGTCRLFLAREATPEEQALAERMCRALID